MGRIDRKVGMFYSATKVLIFIFTTVNLQNRELIQKTILPNKDIINSVAEPEPEPEPELVNFGGTRTGTGKKAPVSVPGRQLFLYKNCKI